ncbi:hypothetical protein KR200_008407 [Drosophila serrata]|nr:hypothetical protein KR200_008407 [Drosophila serrata]
MCEVGNLIDLTPGEEASNEETWFEEPEESIVASNSFKGPYDPFDSIEKEACAKGIALKAQITEDLSVAEAHYPDLSNESPPVGMRKESLGETPRQRCTSSSFQKQLLKLNASRSAANLPKSKICDVSTPFERTILNENQQMLSAESPLKLVEDDDLASSLKFEQDLRMLRISSLDDHKITAETEANLSTTDDPPSKDGEVSQLLQRLRALVHQVVDKTNWHLFDAIIEPIAALIGPGTGFAQVPEINVSPSANSPEAREPDKVPVLPYTRQATFDLDLQGSGSTAVGQEDATEAEGLVPGSKVQDFPDAMTCSAATFDGEPRLLDPAGALPSLNRKEFMTELVDDTLALQINELLERHKLGQSMVGDHEQNGVDPRTVILLVNPSNYSRQAKTQPSCIVQPNPVPLGVSNDADSMRRRSSSLSIHDKPKMRKEITKADSHDENQQNVPPRDVKKAADLASFRQRRNSFSTTSNPPIKIGESRRIVLDRMKTPPINESAVVTKSSGNTKAMIPTKRVAPFVKQPAAASNETTYLNPRQLAAPRNVTVPETPVSLRSKPAPKVFATSTPLPQMRSQQRRSLKPTVGQPSSNTLANASYTTPNFRRPSFSKKPGNG